MGIMEGILNKFFGDDNKSTPSGRLLVESNYRLINMNYTFFQVYQQQIDQLVKNQNQLIEENKQIKEFLKEKFPDE